MNSLQVLRSGLRPGGFSPRCWSAMRAFLGIGTSARGVQILRLSGLRFSASLGILDHEKTKSQQLRADVELHLTKLHLVSDEISQVLDYRHVRTLIVNLCTRRHTNLLEKLSHEVAVELMQFPGVLGVRVALTKLEAFEDCNVSIQTELGEW